ncbi:MAG TPA: winged helix-turn-helix transcriptional regulator [Candidatus Thermoplasmatota archaeon]
MSTRLTKTLAAAGCEDILVTLDEEGARPFTELAREVEDKSTANRALKRLVDAGLVERHVLQDRLRSVEYELTDRGKEVAEIARRLRTIERSILGRERAGGRGGQR